MCSVLPFPGLLCGCALLLSCGHALIESDGALHHGIVMSEESFANKVINVALGALVVSVLGFNVWHFVVRQEPPHPLQDQPAPEFALPQLTPQGQLTAPMALSAQRGKVVLLDFWATYCGPCKKQMPILQQLHKELPADRFTIISINTDNPRQPGRLQMVSEFVKAGGYQFPIVLDTGTAMSTYQVRRIPTLVLVTPDGRIHYAHTGLSSKEELMAQVQKLLQAPDNS
ncbi:MAG: TlpA disulfide reductase family protein [Myxococcota bacterium]